MTQAATRSVLRSWLPRWFAAWGALVVGALLVGLLVAPGVARGAGPEPMVVLDRGLFPGEALVKGKSVRGKAFTLAKPGEPVWVAMDFTAEASAGDNAEASFEFMLDGVPVPIMDTVGLFRARFMRKVAGQQADVRRSVLMKMIPTGKWAPGVETFASFELKRAEGIVPRSLSYVIGQGEPSPELRAAIEEIRGSWFSRYRIVVLLIGTAIALGGVIWWRLLRRP